MTSQKPVVFILCVSAQILNRQGLAGGVIYFSSLLLSWFLFQLISSEQKTFTLVKDVNQYQTTFRDYRVRFSLFLGQPFPKQLYLVNDIWLAVTYLSCPGESRLKELPFFQNWLHITSTSEYSLKWRNTLKGLSQLFLATFWKVRSHICIRGNPKIMAYFYWKSLF